jgi:hypothetical protein
MLNSSFSFRPPFEVSVSGHLQMDAQVRMLVFWNLPWDNGVLLQQNSSPRLVARVFVIRGRKEWNEMLVPKD